MDFNNSSFLEIHLKEEATLWGNKNYKKWAKEYKYKTFFLLMILPISRNSKNSK